MATNSAGLQLLRRCRAVGWSDRLTSNGHVLVTTSRGQTFTFTLKAGDPRAAANALADARRLGLAQAEAERALPRQRRRARAGSLR